MRYLMVLPVLMLTACSSSGQYYKSVDSANDRAVMIKQAQAASEAARYQALAYIAESGDAAAKVAAAMAIALSGSSQQQSGQGLVAPQAVPSEAMQWASVFAAPLSNLGMAYFSMKQNMNASDNSAAVSMSTNKAFSDLGANIGFAGVAAYPFMQQQADVTTTTTTINTVGDNSGTNSGNSGRLAGSSISDSTSTPTVVTQPAPLVVTVPTAP